MEEAWEFAVVSGQQNDGSWEWSSIHTRTKFEMVLSVAIFAAVSFFGVGELRFFPIKPPDESIYPEPLIILVTMMFAAYFLISFYVRSQSDIRRVSGALLWAEKNPRGISGTINALSKAIENLEKQDFEEIKTKLSEITSKLDTLPNRMQLVVDKINETTDERNDFSKRLQKVEQNFDVYFDFENRFRGQNHLRKLNEDARQSLTSEVFEFHKFNQNVASITNLGMELRQATDERSKVLQKQIADVIEVVNKSEHLVSEASLSQVTKMISNIELLQKKIENDVMKMERADKFWMSYRIPLYFCSIVFAISFLHAVCKLSEYFS